MKRNNWPAETEVQQSDWLKNTEKKIVQHTEAMNKPMSSSASLPQLSTARHSSITSCSDSASLTNSLTTSCPSSIPTEHRMRTKDANLRVEEMKQSTHPSSTMIKSIECSAVLTSETDPATDNIPLKQLPSFPIEKATPKKITKWWVEQVADH